MIAYLNGNRLNDVHFHQTGGGSGNDGNIFAEIGYTEIPKDVQDSIDYAKEIKDNWDASVTNRNGAFSGDTKLIYFPVVDTSNVTNMKSMFENSSIQIIPSNFSTNSVTTMSEMFKGCKNLQSLDTSNWNTSKVISLRNMFANSTITTLDCSKWDTSSVDNMSSMFASTQIKNLNIKQWDTSNVTNLIGMFENADVEMLDLSGWDVTKVVAVRNIFASANKLKSIDITGWDTSHVTSWCAYGQPSIIYSNSSLEKIDGYFDLTSCDDFEYGTGIYGCEKLRKFELRNMGKHPKFTNVRFNNTTLSTSMMRWGEDTEEIPDARQSLVNTFITYSFDRATAGYSTCTVELHGLVKKRLSDEEIAQITAKGYTIA